MSSTQDIIEYIGIVAAAIAMVFVVAWRRRSHRRFIERFVDQELCPHLQPALASLRQRGHRIVRAGQRDRELPLEVHITPPFDPQQLADELKLAPPVHVSQRNVLYCEEHFCELRPTE